MKWKHVSDHAGKLEAWVVLKMSAWAVRGDDGIYIVDTGLSFMAPKLLKEAEKLGPVKGILLTHGHLDHVGGLKKLLKKRRLAVYAHEKEIPYAEGRLPYPGRKKPENIVPAGTLTPLPEEDGELLPIAGLQPVFTPGHTPGHVCYYEPETRVMITGDLFTSKKGQLNRPIPMFTADMDQAIKSAGMLRDYDIDVISICHGKDVAEGNEALAQYRKNMDR
ncbi:MBL fold metallo-hydrolase [Bacillus daqingensis]|uniref:MBL fold metallo-hydrolase n=1 Tax=Bacillus daqingensis TaxID=872396 RepID=A0ABV9NSG3_9BACI